MSEIKETTNKTEEFKTETWVFIGSQLNRDGKLSRVFRKIAENGEIDAETLSYGIKQTYTVGGMYSIEVCRGDDGTCRARFGTMKWIRMHGNEELIAEWRIKDTIEMTKKRERDLEKKYRNGHELPNDWNEIVKLYRKLKGSDKFVFHNLLLNKLGSDAKKED